MRQDKSNSHVKTVVHRERYFTFRDSPSPLLYWLRVPHAVMCELRERGYHDGFWRNEESDIDVKVAAAFNMEIANKSRNHYLDEWLSFVDRESAALGRRAALWHPELTDDDGVYVRQKFGRRLIEVEATNTCAAIHKLQLTKWHFGIFYHIAAIGNWRSVVQEHFSLLQRVGLDGVHVSLLGTDEDTRYVAEVAAANMIEYRLEYQHLDPKMYEIPTIKLLQGWCQCHDGYVLYFHTKGVSSPTDVLKQNWRSLMNKFVIEKWRENAEALRSGYDLIGVNWRDTPPISHFPGNFWMASVTYMRELEEFGRYYQNPRHHHPTDERNQHRLGAEFWLGSGSRNPRVYSHVSRNDRIDQAEYWIRYGSQLNT